MKRTLIATATFGLEAVVRREIEALGYSVLRTEDGKVTYEADERGIVRSNLWLRCADRVLLKVDEFEARDFEELFQRVRGIAWEEIIPVDGRFTVLCSTVKSKLSSEPACQRTVKKAIALRLQEFYVLDKMPENGAEYTVKLTLLKDRATLTIDTSGEGLHKRGYRVSDVQAPIKETLAAALIQLSFWKPGRVLLDPCCGSGTLPIEAAMMAAGIPPGLHRNFASEGWEIIDGSLWDEERKAAQNAIARKKMPGSDNEDIGADKPNIIACDIDPRAIEAARANAEKAGVTELIDFRQISVEDLIKSKNFRYVREIDGVVVVTNLPYGQRIGEKEGIQSIYETLRAMTEDNPTWNIFAITSDRDLEKQMGRRADRRRKLYNGNIETTYYQFHGEKADMKRSGG